MFTPAVNPHDLLDKLGWESVREYQSFHGLKPDGVLGPVTARSLAEVRFCHGPELLGSGPMCKWGKNNLTWHWSGSLPGMSEDECREAMKMACGWWSDVCDLTFEFTSNHRTADLLLTTGIIDQAGGTLAWQEMPCGPDGQRNGQYDSRDSWGNYISRPANGRIDLPRTGAHEVGHAIGIPHLAAGNLLQPMFDWNIRKPQAGDIAEAQRRYGPPKKKPDPAEPPKLPPIPLPPAGDDGETDWSAWLGWVHIPAREGDIVSFGPPAEAAR